MSQSMLLIVGLFLPLFPLSMVFNDVFSRVTNSILRIVLLLVWPLVGIALVYVLNIDIPGWVVNWGLLTALLYSFRALVLRDINIWVSFLATSAWAMLWSLMHNDLSVTEVIRYALAFSAPLALLILLGDELAKRFGAAYTGLYNGIAESLPRLSGVLVMVVLAIIATPIFPAFSTMLAVIINVSSYSMTLAAMAVVVWFFWGWAGARLLHGLIIGEDKAYNVTDLACGRAWLFVLMLLLLAVTGVYMIGGLS